MKSFEFGNDGEHIVFVANVCFSEICLMRKYAMTIYKMNHLRAIISQGIGLYGEKIKGINHSDRILSETSQRQLESLGLFQVIMEEGFSKPGSKEFSEEIKAVNILYELFKGDKTFKDWFEGLKKISNEAWKQPKLDNPYARFYRTYAKGGIGLARDQA